MLNLFFRVRDGKEYVWNNEKEAWVAVQPFVIELGNAYAAEDYARLREVTGLAEEEEIARKIEPLFELALYVSGGLSAKKVEKLIEDYLSLPEKLQQQAAEVMNFLDWFTGKPELLRLWAGQGFSVGILPCLALNGKMGWFCAVETVLEAAAKEVVLAVMHGWKPFKFCRDCFRFFHGKACPFCSVEKTRKRNFQNVLRVHASREVKKLPPEERKAAARELNRIREEIKKYGVSDKLVEDYRSICEKCGLPLDWYGRYKKHL